MQSTAASRPPPAARAHGPEGAGDMNERSRDPLDVALGSLPREVQPSRDLWADIAASIESSPSSLPSQSAPPARPWFRLAAGFLLVIASSITTYVVMQQSTQ